MCFKRDDLGFLERGSFSEINVSVFVNDVVRQDVCFEKGTRCFVGQHVHNEIQSIHPAFGCTLLVHDALVGIKCQGQRGMHVSGLGLQSMHKRYNFGRRWIASTVEIKHKLFFEMYKQRNPMFSWSSVHVGVENDANFVFALLPIRSQRKRTQFVTNTSRVLCRGCIKINGRWSQKGKARVHSFVLFHHLCQFHVRQPFVVIVLPSRWLQGHKHRVFVHGCTCMFPPQQRRRPTSFVGLATRRQPCGQRSMNGLRDCAINAVGGMQSIPFVTQT